MPISILVNGAWVPTSVVTTGVAPSAPTNVVATSPSADQIAVTWAAPNTSGSSPVTGYTVVKQTGATKTTTTYASTIRTASFTGLAPGAVYTIVVTATNAAGISAPSSTATVTVKSPTSGTNFLLSPSTYGYPDATNTGYTSYFDPALGRKLQLSDLTPYSGSFQTTSANQVIEKMHFTSNVKVSHPGVIFRGCLIEKTNGSGGNGVVYGVSDHNQGLSDYWTMDYCTLIGHPTAGEVTMLNVEWGNVTHCDISGGTDGANPWGPHNTLFTDNYVHDLTPFGGAHSDCLQIVSGAMQIRHNTLISANPSYPIGAYAAGDTSVFPGNTSGIQIGKLTGQLLDVYFEDNLCDGGNYMFNSNWGADTPDSNGVTHTQEPGTSVYIRNNRFGRDFRYGVATHTPGGHSFVISGNVWDDDGTAAWG